MCFPIFYTSNVGGHFFHCQNDIISLGANNAEIDGTSTVGARITPFVTRVAFVNLKVIQVLINYRAIASRDFALVQNEGPLETPRFFGVLTEFLQAARLDQRCQAFICLSCSTFFFAWLSLRQGQSSHNAKSCNE